jgi:hypothetical protein
MVIKIVQRHFVNVTFRQVLFSQNTVTNLIFSGQQLFSGYKVMLGRVEKRPVDKMAVRPKVMAPKALPVELSLR